MAKKDTPPVAPVITKLPLPNSENALVIDLPDGQKLVVGKMATGTVIEVATWRGTGRPDSRTTRLMLGVTSQEANADVSTDGEAPASPAKRGPLDQVKAFWNQSLKIFRDLLRKAKPSKSIKVKKVKNSDSKAELESAYSSSSQASDDVQAWLDSISAKSEQKAAKKVILGPSGQKRPVTRKAATKKPSGKR